MDLHIPGRRHSRLTMRRYHHSGVRPVRVLVIGDGDDLLGPVEETSLASRTAERIWLTTRRGVDVDVLTDLAPVLRAVHGVFGTWRLWRYDVVVVMLAHLPDAARRPRAIARVEELLQAVLADVAGATDLVVLGADETAGHVAEEHRGGTPGARVRRAIEGFDSPRVRYRAVQSDKDDDGRVRAWAGAAGAEVARSVADRTREAAAAVVRAVPDPEAPRQRALDELAVVGRGPDPRLDDLVELARNAFGTQSAEINFIDRDRQWKMAVAGAERGENPRAHSFCSLTIERAEPMVVGDARLDPVLRHSPLVLGPRPIRFYAAHPIESVDGYRIGSFCVYDPAPRDVRGLDLAVLRDLALLAQAEITGVDDAPVGWVAPTRRR